MNDRRKTELLDQIRVLEQCNRDRQRRIEELEKAIRPIRPKALDAARYEDSIKVEWDEIEALARLELPDPEPKRT
jgi:hypothetical protein